MEKSCIAARLSVTIPERDVPGSRTFMSNPVVSAEELMFDDPMTATQRHMQPEACSLSSHERRNNQLVAWKVGLSQTTTLISTLPKLESF
jgi:hypothetical protein